MGLGPDPAVLLFCLLAEPFLHYLKMSVFQFWGQSFQGHLPVSQHPNVFQSLYKMLYAVYCNKDTYISRLLKQNNIPNREVIRIARHTGTTIASISPSAKR